MAATDLTLPSTDEQARLLRTIDRIVTLSGDDVVTLTTLTDHFHVGAKRAELHRRKWQPVAALANELITSGFLERAGVTANATSGAKTTPTYKLTKEGKRAADELTRVGNDLLSETPEHLEWRVAHEAAEAQVATIRSQVVLAANDVTKTCLSTDDPADLDSPDPEDPRTIVAPLEDAVELLQVALDRLSAPEPPDPR